jgi:hypothetical protein
MSDISPRLLQFSTQTIMTPCLHFRTRILNNKNGLQNTPSTWKAKERFVITILFTGTFKTNKVTGSLKPRPLFLWLRCTQDTRVPDGTHSTSMQSPLTFTYLLHCYAYVCILACKKSLVRLCSQETTVCFTLVSAANRFSSMFFLEIKGDGNQWDPVPPNGLVKALRPGGYGPPSLKYKSCALGFPSGKAEGDM